LKMKIESEENFDGECFEEIKEEVSNLWVRKINLQIMR
jgi:hypothetical protein